MSNFNINKVVLAGRLTSDVELKKTPNGVSVCSFNLAVNRRVSREGEQAADFIKISAWRKTAEFISTYFKKGSAICITGSIQTKSWKDQNGQRHGSTEVVADEAMFVDGKSEQETNAEPYIPEAYTNPSGTEEPPVDDNLPF